MELDTIDKEMLNLVQANMPLVQEPFAKTGSQLGISEEEVILRLKRMKRSGIIRRIGATVNKTKLGEVGMLIAMRVPTDEIERVASAINAHNEVTHNYVRYAKNKKMDYNVWFTISAPQKRADEIITVIKGFGYPLICLPTKKTFKIGIKFEIR
jgi:DNA-binding Lrp family transcriptional regulator